MADPTQLVPLGRTGLAVSRLGLGTAPLGNLYQAVAEETARATVARALELGLRLFDSAPLYGHGVAERRLGAGLATAAPSGVTRDSLVVATKVGRLLRPGTPPERGQAFTDVPPVNPVFDFSHDGVLRSFEESLYRLGLDRVDVLHIHDPDLHYDEARAGAYRALDRLRSEGTIRAVGVGMNQAEMPSRFVREADIDCVLIAGRYSLLDQGALAELLPLCAERGVGVIVGGVFNSGLLADPRPGAPFDYAPAPAEKVERARRLAEVCKAHGVSLAAAALQFPLGHPAVTTVLTGTRSPEELEENERGFRTPVPSEMWEALRSRGLLPPDVPTPSPECLPG